MRNPTGKAPPLDVPYEATRLESVEDVRQAARALRVPSAKDSAPPAPDAMPYRPLHRPPMLLLCILDDGKDDGEWTRVRGDRCVIGRTEGDVTIPHDGMISTKHAALQRVSEQGRHRWFLHDLNSTNGTYARVSDAVLTHGQEVLLGSRCYRFETAAALRAEAPAAEAGPSKSTRGWRSPSPADLHPSLVEIRPEGEGKRYALDQAEHWVGQESAQCSIAPGDPLLSPRHARVLRMPDGAWRVENHKSLNGVWLRIQRIPVSGTCHFQAGEQRFTVKVL